MKTFFWCACQIRATAKTGNLKNVANIPCYTLKFINSFLDILQEQQFKLHKHLVKEGIWFYLLLKCTDMKTICLISVSILRHWGIADDFIIFANITCHPLYIIISN